MKNVFEAEGDLREVDPLAALVTCWRERSSGALRFARGGTECGFDLDQGEVVAVVSSDPRFETAAILVRAGKLAADTIERLASQGGDPALAALQTGLLTRREWKWGEKIRGIEVLSDLLSWNDGRYSFDAAAPVNAGDFRLPVPRLLLELFLRSRDRNLIDHQIGSPEQVLVRGERFDVEFASFGLTADAESVVRLIDGRSTAAEISEKAPAEEFAVRKLLAALVTLGLIHPVPVAPVRPPERPSERDRFPEPEPTAAEMAEPQATEVIPPPLELPSDLQEPAPADFPVEVDARQRGPEPDLLDLPAAGGSPLDRFESASTGAWDPEPAPGTASSEDPWGRSPIISEPSQPPEESEPRRGGAGSALAWSLGILAVAVVALVLWRGRSPAPIKSAGRTRPTPIPAVTFPPPATAPSLEPTRRAPVAAATVVPPAPSPAPTSRRAAPPASTRGEKPPSAAPTAIPAAEPRKPAAEPPAESRESWARRAERDRHRLDAERRTRYSIQLELVCEVPSLQEAWRHDRGQSLWLLPVSHGGRDCFRVCWGRYPTLEAAKKAKPGVPSYFVTARNHPAVVSVR